MEMPLNVDPCDEDMIHIQDLHASPAKSDASSVDIYSGLDTLPEQAAEKSSPSRNCLDLYEEIITEEGTAKEASFSDLSAEYEKCQRQIKQLIMKLKEMQSMNSSLQNENQCLKKNISALIKTARVEITRKEDEIDRLNQRLGAPGKNHSSKPNPLPLMSINKSKTNNDNLSKNIKHTESMPKKAVNLQSKDITSPYPKKVCDKEKTCTESSLTCSLEKLAVKQCKENTVYCSQEQALEPKNKKEKVLDSQSKDNERTLSKEKSKSNFASLVSESSSESSNLKEKASQTLIKCGKSESFQDSKNVKSETACETENRVSHSSFTKEKTELKELENSKDKQVKKYERSPHRKDSRAYEKEKEKNAESRHRTSEKNEKPRMSKRTPHISTPKDNGSHKLSETSDAKRSSDAGRRDKRPSEYNESKHGTSESKHGTSESKHGTSESKHGTSESKHGTSESKHGTSESKHGTSESKHGTSESKHGTSESKHGTSESKHGTSESKHGTSESKHGTSESKHGISESKHGTKDSKPSKSENSARNKPTHEHKNERSDRNRRDEKKRSKDEQERSRHDRKDKGQQAKEKDAHQSSRKEKALYSKASEKNKNEGRAKEVDCTQKDLKLSFMETLNLTLSPVKKASEETQVVSGASSMKGEVEAPPVEGSSQLCVMENNTDAIHPLKTDLRHNDLASIADVTTEAFTIEDCRPVSRSEPVADAIVCSNEDLPKSAIDESSELLTKLAVKDKQVECIVLDSDNSEVDAQGLADGSDFFDLDSFIEIDRCSGSPTSETHNVSIPAEQIQDDGSIIKKNDDANDKEITLKSNVTETPKELLPETDTKSTCLSIAEELNKENCQPENKSEFGSKVASSDEVEEGEILSEDEPICDETMQPSSPIDRVPDQMTSMTKSQSGRDGNLLPLPKPDTPILPKEKPAKKKKSTISTQSKVSACPTSKEKKLSADSCLDGILEIVIPSSIQDILQMLRTIRKHIRMKYMKFKIQFSLAQFHRVIDTATLCFITLVRNLDFTSLCSSQERLQKKLCKHIETKMKKLKKNGIVDRIFEQHLIDMKKRLWKFVDDQLDSLFDILKAVLLKLCDKAEIEKNTSCINTQKSVNPVKNSQKERSKCMEKAAPSSGPCPRRLEFHSQPRVSNPKLQNDKTMQKELANESTEISLNSKNIDVTSSIFNSTPKPPYLSPAKTSMSNEPCTKNQQNSSGLSFNLVSDDHMGDIFKSLLHSSDNLSLNNMPENMWILGTPEKTVSSNQKFDLNVDSLSVNKTPTKAAFPWSSISPPHVQPFPRLETVLNPDVFDESCLLEIPTSASSSKSLSSSEDRLKSFSSVLLEDLAVSLTVPSPLKSDSHLSFLRPVCEAECVSEVELKCREGSVVDEEDATEQDIHLTLDSDNSSVASLDDTGETGSFQYHPSEPMQAVIMEKSNDHFIVKIRRAVSSSSPVSDCSSEGTGNTVPESVNTVEGNKLKMDSRPDTQSEAYNGNILLHPNNIDLANITEKSVIDGNRPIEVELPVQENKSILILSPCRSQHLELSAELKLPADIVEVDCKQSITNCIEKTCTPVPSTDILPIKPSYVNTVNLNLRKKRKSVEEEPSAKRQKTLSPSDQDNGTKCNKTEESSNKKKRRRAVSDGTINLHSSKVSPSSLSAKNVIKKKGSVIVSWTRDEDRAILLECQKLGPSKKTFLVLSSSMNKYPHQVEERFRQLLKLFKKSRNSIS
ncbi:CASP8-associated protein 2 isoform X2 [Dendropsophus ebraccatus]|uniref:CASP8-associated protein 2 isoform X2 n=1 Tax=Dendropsophus ebraccatus TaxID=150705 RepID=UPI0038316AFF